MRWKSHSPVARVYLEEKEKEPKNAIGRAIFAECSLASTQSIVQQILYIRKKGCKQRGEFSKASPTRWTLFCKVEVNVGLVDT